ncbi:MAG: hypothetical protein C4309_01230 [Chloroflexota bacterium]
MRPEVYVRLFEECIDALLITDGDGLILAANRRLCALLDYTPADLIGRSVETIHPALAQDTRWKALAPGDTLRLQLMARSRDNRDLPIEAEVKSILYAGKTYLKWVERDVSRWLRAEEGREDQLAMVFHDLRSPLGNVISSLEMLSTALPTDEHNADLNTLVDIALRSSRRIAHLLNALLDIRRLETGQPLDREPASLQAIVAETVSLLAHFAQSRHINLAVQVPADIPELLVDRDLLQRVIYNLLDNAIKHTHTHTDVTISAQVQPEAGNVLVTITDNGPGIPPEYREIIFGKYRRIQREGAPRGLGLGLALCRMAIKAHSGRIWVEDTPGGGATFKFTLPLPAS